MLKPRPSRSWHRTVLLPLSVGDAVKVVLPAIAIGAIAALLFHDVVVLALALGLAYTCVLSIGRHFAEYDIDLPDQQYFNRAVQLLDATREFQRVGKHTKWVRKRMIHILSSKTDGVEIFRDKSRWIVRGRRFYILSLASALDKRALKGTL